MQNLTKLLQAWSDGDELALSELAPMVYAELHRLASYQMSGERGSHMLQPSALVNEAFLRLRGTAGKKWDSRHQFYAIASRLMRQVLVDFARTEVAQKRGARAGHIQVDDLRTAAEQKGKMSVETVIAIDSALDELERLHERQAKVVTLRFFGGLENLEIAETLGISEPTVARDWRQARAWLFAKLGAT